MPVAWNDDNPADTQRLSANVAGILRRIVAAANQRSAPSVAMAQQWHRDLYSGIQLPVDYYAGEIRDTDLRFPELVAYEVRVGGHLGVLSKHVPTALADFEAAFVEAVDAVDLDLLGPADISGSGAQLYVTLAAVAHGEWIRIHPFANGNGRTARFWTHSLAARYDLPPLLRVKPETR